LTGLFNHRFIIDTLARLIDENNRYKQPLSIAMFDIDNFKKVNDKYGHLFGDEVLARVASFIEGTLRKTDMVGRFGGEEFLVLFVLTDLKGAAESAKRIVEGVEQIKWDGKNLKVTISGGVCEKAGEDISALIKKADSLLYAAKEKGKNRVEY
jgi:diguanylate cyclase (GGDEF)-like protein